MSKAKNFKKPAIGISLAMILNIIAMGIGNRSTLDYLVIISSFALIIWVIGYYIYLRREENKL